MRAEPTGGYGVIRATAEITRHLIVGAHVLNIEPKKSDYWKVNRKATYVVDDTGIEPVTPTMSMWCSTAEPIVLGTYEVV
ncbi:MAG: hypothetical protein RLZZ545_537 [Actinomycetota bacterium]